MIIYSYNINGGFPNTRLFVGKIINPHKLKVRFCDMIEYSVEKDGRTVNARFSFNGMHCIDVCEKWLHAPGRHSCYTLFFVKRGELRLWSSSGTLTLKENQAVILPPMSRLRSAHSNDTGICFFQAYFEASEPFFEPMQTYTAQKPLSVTSNLSLLQSNNRSDSPFGAYSDALAFSIVCELAKPSLRGSARENSLVSNVCRIIEENITRELDTEFIANALELDRSHISRVFSRVTGKTIKTYINEKRVCLACELLTASSFSVSKIASLTGFAQANLFTKFFTYHTGVTPSDYRRELHDILPRSKKR